MKKPLHTFEVFQDKKKLFHWRVRHKNGKILFKTSEGYKRTGTMMRIWNNFVAKYDEMEYKDLTIKK